MWRIVAGLTLAIIHISAQRPHDGLLPAPRHIVGLVLDSEGHPVKGASVDHTGDHLRAYVTDASGRFELDTRAPSLVIRKKGFQSEWIQIKAGPIRVSLRPNADTSLRRCGEGPHVGTIGILRFPHIRGVKVGLPGNDIDYVTESFSFGAASGREGILHGVGPLWSIGLPVDTFVWQSVSYSETTYTLGSVTITDARGLRHDNRFWRHIGAIGESACVTYTPQQ